VSTVIAPAVEFPYVTKSNPAIIWANSAASMFKVPVPPAIPMVVPDVSGAITRLPEPETSPPRAIASV